MHLQELVRIRDTSQEQALGRCGEWVSHLGLFIGGEVGVVKSGIGTKLRRRQVPLFPWRRGLTRLNGLATVLCQDFGPAAGLCRP